MASKKSRRLAATRAAKRIPLVGTAVVILPVVEAASEAALMQNITNPEAWKNFFISLKNKYASTDGPQLLRTYGPIATYLITRRFAGKHISRILRPLGVKF